MAQAYPGPDRQARSRPFRVRVNGSASAVLQVCADGAAHAGGLPPSDGTIAPSSSVRRRTVGVVKVTELNKLTASQLRYFHYARPAAVITIARSSTSSHSVVQTVAVTVHWAGRVSESAALTSPHRDWHGPIRSPHSGWHIALTSLRLHWHAAMSESTGRRCQCQRLTAAADLKVELGLRLAAAAGDGRGRGSS